MRNQNQNKQSTVVYHTTDSVQIHEKKMLPKQNNINNDYELFELDDFANNPFSLNVELKNMNKLFGEPYKKFKCPIANKHDKSQIDSIIGYVYNQIDTIQLYKFNKEIYFYNAIINSQNIVLKNNIRIGISKSYFLKRLKINSDKNKNILIITDSEEMTNNVFYFTNGILSKISLYSSLD